MLTDHSQELDGSERGGSQRFLPGIADFSYCLNKWRYRSMRDSAILAELESLGACCFQLDFLFDLEGGAENRREIHAAAVKAGIALTGADYSKPSAERFEKQVAAAKELGIEIVRHACGAFLGLQEPLPLATLEEHLTQAARIYEKAGLRYALENHQDYPASRLAEVFKKIGSPHIGIFLDTGNSIALMEDPLATARHLAPFTFGVHVKEYAVLPAPGGFDLVGVPLGDGVVDNAAVLSLIADRAPAGQIPLLLENPIERCRINVFSEPYRRHLGFLTLSDFGPVADLIERSKEKFPDGITLAFEDPSLTPAEAQSAERAHNRAAYVKMLSYL